MTLSAKPRCDRRFVTRLVVIDFRLLARSLPLFRVSFVSLLHHWMCRMDVGTISIAGTEIKPLIFVKVKVEPENNLADIMVERVELDGSEAVRNAAGTFNGKDIRAVVVGLAGKSPRGWQAWTLMYNTPDSNEAVRSAL